MAKQINVKPSTKQPVIDLKSAVKAEMERWETNGVRGEKLDFIYNSLLSIQATSTESERNFSAAGRIVNKLSTRLADQSIKQLSLLQGYFKTII